MSRIVFSPRAARELKKLDSQVRKRILEKLQASADDPLRMATKLVSARVGTYRYRIGEYRVVFDFEDDTIAVLRIGHPRNIYS